MVAATMNARTFMMRRCSHGFSAWTICFGLTAKLARTYGRVPHRPPLRVGGLNLPQGVALVTARSGQTPPAPKFVLGFPGFRRQSLEQLWIGHVFFRFGTI